MIKLTLLALLILLKVSSVGQNLDTAHLQDYSYLIFGFTDVKDSSGFKTFNITQGTCFFIKSDNKTFLVSAKHAVTPWDGDSLKKKDVFPDTLKLRLEDSTGHPFFIDLDIRQTKDSITGDYFYNDPDIFLFEFFEADRFKVHTIESKIEDFDNSRTEIVTYGYPKIKLVPGNFDSFIKQKPSITSGRIINKSTIHQLPINEKINTTSFAFQRTDSLPKKGCSGSPVFYRKDSLDNWKFGGVFVRSSNEVPISTVVKPEFVQRLLDDKK